MSERFRNSSPGALTMAQATERERKRAAERRKAAELAKQGRGGDTEVAHVTLGEIVLPEALQTPAVLNALRQAAVEANIQLERFRVGSSRNSINPQTGQPEFFDLGTFKSGPYSMCDHGAQMDSCEGWVPGFLRDKPSGYMPTPEDLAKLPDAQKQRYAEYYEGTGDMADVLATGLGGAGRLYSGARNYILRGLGKEAGYQASSREDIAKAYRGSIQNPKPRF